MLTIKIYQAESMKQNWINSQERFKSLQTQARTTRDEKAAIAKELADLKTKLESGTVAPANVSLQHLPYEIEH